EVRAITPNRCGSILPSCEIISSVRPSLKYSWLASPVRFSKGKTASITLARACCALARLCDHHSKDVPSTRTATTAAIASQGQENRECTTLGPAGTSTAGISAGLAFDSGEPRRDFARGTVSTGTT